MIVLKSAEQPGLLRAKDKSHAGRHSAGRDQGEDSSGLVLVLKFSSVHLVHQTCNKLPSRQIFLEASTEAKLVEFP